MWEHSRNNWAMGGSTPYVQGPTPGARMRGGYKACAGQAESTRPQDTVKPQGPVCPVSPVIAKEWLQDRAGGGVRTS